MTLPRLFLTRMGRLLALTLSLLWPTPAANSEGRAKHSAWLGVRRRLVLLGFIPLFALVQLIHWIGFLLDEVLYPGYRRVQVREPLFVLGVPRSGTTHLHRVLAQDDQYTTFSTWECLFALSVTQRRFWLALGALDARLGRPMARLLAWIESHAFAGLADVHTTGLADPEEDYFALTPVLACFILILPFPTDPLLWRMGTFDRDMPEAERARLLDFYHRCLQRHLYVHGPDKRLLSKNAAFAPLAGSLRRGFPDARFVVCLREPGRTLPSQLSAVEPGVRLFGVLDAVPDFRERLARQLGFYYENLGRALGDLGEDRCAWVTMADLKRDLAGSVTTIYGALGLPLSAGFRGRLERAAEQARGYRSAHDYRLEQFGLTPAAIAGDLEGIYRGLATRSVTASHPLPGLDPGEAVGKAPDQVTPTTERARPC